ncbi:MAG: hypothetical protein KAT28_04365 [Candidatus Aenigmarchaeota archaeon]|nr:hypothetical protein [Candidatus Aenigmarchaeota archaeon]
MIPKLKIGLRLLIALVVLILIWFNFSSLYDFYIQSGNKDLTQVSGLLKDSRSFENKTLSSTDNFTKIQKNALNFTGNEELTQDYNLNFTETVNKLDTPEKLLVYMKNNFKFRSYEGHISYSPEEFFHLKEGDCKNLATFGSYALKQHGYEVKIMCLKLSGELKGQHAITLFHDKDGNLKYITNNAKNLELIKVKSLDDILDRESERLGCQITEYGFVPAGSAYVWVDNL